MLNEFMDKVKGLARNPIGIIALFISLIYGIACYVLSSSIDNLCGQQERLPLIWFIIIFPVLILIVFTFLVVYHHKKLYAPADFKDEKNFVFTFSQDVPTELKKINLKLNSLNDEKDSEKIHQEIKNISKDLEKIREKSQEIPINSLWRLNHWGSKCANIENGKMIFRGTKAPQETDGSHIDLIENLNLGASYEISCFVKSDNETNALFQLWCHDKTAEPNGVNVSTPYKTPSTSGERIKLIFKADFNRNIRIHLQYKPGQGRIEVSDVRVSEIGD